MKKSLAVITVCIMLFLCLVPAAAQGEDVTFRFRDDGTFTILHLTDTQDDTHPSPDMLKLLRMSIEASDPDLIVFTGDLVEDSRAGDIASDDQPFKEGVIVKNIRGKIDYEKTRTNVEKTVDTVFSVFESYAVPYVIALGNNDRHVGLSSSDWLEIFSKYPHLIVFDESDDDQDGLDYHVSIKGNDGRDKFTLWLLDTCNDGISKKQIEWYKDASKAITSSNGGEVIPALAFQHIQADDIGNLFEKCKATDNGARKAKDGYVRLNSEIAEGYNMFSYEPGITSAEFSAWKECGDIVGAFFGHQHVEGFSGTWDGIKMGFTYGCEMAKTGPYGFRTISLNENDPADFSTELFRYTGSVKLGTSKIEPESVFTGEASKASIMRIIDFFIKIINLFAVLFR